MAMQVFRGRSIASARRWPVPSRASCPPHGSPVHCRWAHAAAVAPKWKPSSALDELAHRLRDIQTLPYVVVANPHLAHVYESYLQAFERFRRVPEIRSVEDNDRYCKVLEETLKEHATVIPRLAIGVLEVRNLMKSDETDKFMTTMLRARISRRVIAEQHLALSETFNSPWHFPNAQTPHDQESVGEIFLKCNAKEIVESCGKTTQELVRCAYGAHVEVPEIKIYGHLEATFPYILSHLEYIIGELLRNSIQAVIEQRKSKDAKPPPIEVLICETSQHVIIRISDQGGGIPNDLLPYLWSFSKGPRREKRLKNLARVPKLLGTLQELQVDDKSASELQQQNSTKSSHSDAHRGSLASLTSRAPDLRLGIGLPMSRLYAVLGWELGDPQSRGVWCGCLSPDLEAREQERATYNTCFDGRHLEGACLSTLLFTDIDIASVASIAMEATVSPRIAVQPSTHLCLQPIFDAGVNAAGHAHPLPVRLSPRALEEQRVRALIARQPIAVKLLGLPCERVPTVASILTPRVRRSPINENVNPNHLDLTECWKGLSHPQATELTMWYHFLNECLHVEVRAILYERLTESLLQSEGNIDDVNLASFMLKSLCSEPRRVFCINFVDLIDSMMGMFHDQFPYKAASMSSNWSQFSGGLSRFLHNFLRLQDCFCDTPSGPCFESDFVFQYSNSVLTATGNVAWQVPGVRFLSLPDTLPPGEEYRITPFALDDVLTAVRSKASDDYADDVTYTIPRSSLGFAWDSRKRCFKAVAPDYGDNQNHIAETVLCASITTQFPDGVRFERQARWSIRLGVSPAESSPNSEVTSPDLNRRNTLAHKRLLDAAERALRTPQRVDTKNLNVVQSKGARRPDPLSPQKRKVSKPEVVDDACETKRRRHGLTNENGDRLSVDTRIGGIAWAGLLEQPFDGEGARPETDTHRLDTTQRCPDLCPICPRAPADWSYQSAQDDSGFSSSETPLGDSDSSEPDSAGVERRGSFQQQQILRNYHEFADRRLRKDAGLLISPVSDGERRAFESIFLDDSEGFSPLSECAAGDAVMGDV
ncbi:hypothetical protein OPT61_g9909 [Boeremia exigua]|uniref:Uncharacterized protein n=1 Tax=Boeremia exigua TaxID=749465 RepID=A0ACC2HSX5_9PLEO|nr:hypothetical protein OPT61_g9909 [Boeremia exigua]